MISTCTAEVETVHDSCADEIKSLRLESMAPGWFAGPPPSRPVPWMVDLFSGRGGASRAQELRGWRVTRVELSDVHRPDVRADVRRLQFKPDLRPDLLWASPPCQEFSRWRLPYFRRPDRVHLRTRPSLDLVRAALAAVRLFRPRYWILENVIGAETFLGLPRQRVAAASLWGNFPLILCHTCRHKTWVKNTRRNPALADSRAAMRSEIPFRLSLATARAVEIALCS